MFVKHVLEGGDPKDKRKKYQYFKLFDRNKKETIKIGPFLDLRG